MVTFLLGLFFRWSVLKALYDLAGVALDAARDGEWTDEEQHAVADEAWKLVRAIRRE